MEKRGDFIVIVSSWLWNEKQVITQQFFDSIAITGTIYPTIVISDDSFDLDSLKNYLEDNSELQKEGMLVLQIIVDLNNKAFINTLAFLTPQEKPK